jgi:hypothetical protein
MCTTQYYRSAECKDKCRWLEIGIPCGTGKGFNTCEDFRGQRTGHRSRWHLNVPKNRCPRHGLMHNYDTNRIAIIKKEVLRCSCM